MNTPPEHLLVLAERFPLSSLASQGATDVVEVPLGKAAQSLPITKWQTGLPYPAVPGAWQI